MLITKVMHYLLINGSSPFRARDGTSEWMISVGTKKGDSSEAGAWKMHCFRIREKRAEEEERDKSKAKVCGGKKWRAFGIQSRGQIVEV